MAMAQRYLLLDVDRYERHGAVQGRMPEFIFGGLEPVAKLLTVPVPRPGLPESCYLHPSTQRASLGALALATELLDAIFEHLDASDALCLGVTNSILTAVSWRHICRRREASVACWAGDRIVCLGDRASSALSLAGHDVGFAAAAGFARVGTDRRIGVPGLSLRDCVLQRTPCADERARCAALLDATEPWYPADRSWALFNISKRQLVRADAVGRVTDSGADGPFVQSDYNLGNVVVVLTTWPGLIGQGCVGAWAGDRLRIAPVYDDDGGWVDVSNEIVPLVEKFLHRTYPGDVQEDYADYYGPCV